MAYGDPAVIGGDTVYEVTGDPDLDFADVQSVDGAAVLYYDCDETVNGRKIGHLVVGSASGTFVVDAEAHAKITKAEVSTLTEYDGTEVNWGSIVDQATATTAINDFYQNYPTI